MVGMQLSIERIISQDEESAEVPSAFSFCPEELGIGPIGAVNIIKLCNMAMRICTPFRQKTRFRITIVITTGPSTSGNCMSSKQTELSYDELLDRIFQANTKTPLFSLCEEPLGVEERALQNLVAQFNQDCTIWLEETKGFKKTVTTNTLESFSVDDEDAEKLLHDFVSLVDLRYAHSAPLSGSAAAPESPSETDDDKAMIVDITDNTVFVPESNRSSECQQELLCQESTRKQKKMTVKSAETLPVKFVTGDAELVEFDCIELTDSYVDKK